jgi:hypothetical protein
MNKKIFPLAVISFGAVLLFTGCLPGDGTASPVTPAGLFWGIWHGWIAPVSLIISLFRDPIQIYEPYNTGFWYDLAYYAAIIGGFGSLQLSRKGKRKNQKDGKDR